MRGADLRCKAEGLPFRLVHGELQLEQGAVPLLALQLHCHSHQAARLLP